MDNAYSEFCRRVRRNPRWLRDIPRPLLPLRTEQEVKDMPVEPPIEWFLWQDLQIRSRYFLWEHYRLLQEAEEMLKAAGDLKLLIED